MHVFIELLIAGDALVFIEEHLVAGGTQARVSLGYNGVRDANVTARIRLARTRGRRQGPLRGAFGLVAAVGAVAVAVADPSRADASAVDVAPKLVLIALQRIAVFLVGSVEAVPLAVAAPEGQDAAPQATPDLVRPTRRRS